MYTIILNSNEIKKFNELTGMNTNKVLISKHKKYYYAAIIDKQMKVRISKKVAELFI